MSLTLSPFHETSFSSLEVFSIFALSLVLWNPSALRGGEEGVVFVQLLCRAGLCTLGTHTLQASPSGTSVLGFSTFPLIPPPPFLCHLGLLLRDSPTFYSHPYFNYCLLNFYKLLAPLKQITLFWFNVLSEELGLILMFSSAPWFLSFHRTSFSLPVLVSVLPPMGFL